MSSSDLVAYYRKGIDKTKMSTKFKQDIDLLSDLRSPKRCAAAKRLRKLADPAAGPALVAALKKEIEDRRTWETQYQMIMALGACNYKKALRFMESLSPDDFCVMVQIAIGDAIVRLSRKDDHDASAAIRLIKDNQPHYIHGAMQAVAMMRMVPNQQTIRQLVDYGLSRSSHDNKDAVVWLLRAAPGWPEPLVAPLLKKWGASESLGNQQVDYAVELLRKRKYYRWSPL